MRSSPVVLVLAALAACEHSRSPAGAPGAPEKPVVDDRMALLLAGLGPQIQEAMGTREERAARAPYSPPGWPLERGDTVTYARWRELEAEFGEWATGVVAPFWVGKTVFGALTVVRVEIWKLPGGPPIQYHGHYPMKTDSRSWSYSMPDHLRRMSQTKEGFAEIARSVFHPRAKAKLWPEMPGLQRVWTREAWLDGYAGEGGQ